MSVNYEIEVYTLDSTTGNYTRIGELITWYNLTWNKKDNQPAYARFSINTYSEEGRFIQPFKNWILIKRDGVPEFFGSIVDVRGNHGPDSGSLNVQCFDMLYTLMNLYTEGYYVAQNTDAGTIASALVALAQAKSYGNFGIQNGTIQTVGNTNETLYYQSIGNALVNQADNITGYHFTFIPILDANDLLDYIQFNVFSALGTLRSNLPPLELGYSVNVVDFAIAGEVYNKIYTLGQGTNEVEVATSENNTSKEIFALREVINKENGIGVKASLQARADEYLNNSQGVKLELAFSLTQGVSPYYGDFGLYDTLLVDISIGNTFFNFEGTAQIKEIQFAYDTSTNKETISPIIEYYKIIS